MITIQALIDNKASEHKALKNEHGLSLLITSGKEKILFDTGSSDNFMFNAHRLGVSLNDVSSVVLSHNHYDHALGFRMLKESGNEVKRLYTGDDFFDKKYAANNNVYTLLSAGWDENFIKKYNMEHIIVSSKIEIANEIYVVSGFTMVEENIYETIPKRFVREHDGRIINDTFNDEVCIVIQKDDGLVMVVGCSHRGIVNMTSYVSKLFNKPIREIYGGVHLNEADDERREYTIKKLSSFGVKVAGFSHCSGDQFEELCVSHGLESAHLSVGSLVFI